MSAPIVGHVWHVKQPTQPGGFLELTILVDPADMNVRLLVNKHEAERTGPRVEISQEVSSV